MIEIKLIDFDEQELINRAADKLAQKIIPKEFKMYGDDLEEGFYTPYDKFKNYVANLVADRIYKHIVEDEEIKHRVKEIIDKAENRIINDCVKMKNRAQK